jgi:cellulose synthase (UDP-forming)
MASAKTIWPEAAEAKPMKLEPRLKPRLRQFWQVLGTGAARAERLRPTIGHRLDWLTPMLVDGLPQGFDRLLNRLPRRSVLLILGLLMALAVPLITMRLAIVEQALVAGLAILVGQVVLHLEDRAEGQGEATAGTADAAASEKLEAAALQSRTSEYLHLFLVMLSTLLTLRYLYYRSNYTLSLEGWMNTTVCLLLYGAELYAIATLFLSYFQTLKIKERQPVDLANFPPEQWFSVDIYIPTYNEDVEIVRKTVLGALAIDYPAAKKQVYVLDDGRAEKHKARRAKLAAMCVELGCTMLTRDNNDHAKAGNINTALPQTQGELVLILDCDHIPARNFLQATVGFFFKPNVALVQTPHWFYNPDPFERNLLTGGQIPVGNELFYKVLQKGNDYWNAAFFCGSAAVIRRQYVLEIGGIATETVTEDCHTSLRLHSRGYDTVYYDKIMVAGLAPEMFSAYVGQQVRWARGMAQILRLENPLFNRQLKLSLAQRLCYLSATSHFFFGFPRLMYVLAPTFYLLLGINSVKGLGLETLFYALPHILLSMYANHIPYKHVRFSFWNEIYEFAMSFQAGIVTLLALVNPQLGSFNVTDKGLTVTERNFDFDSVRYLIILGVFTAVSLLMIPFWLILRPEDLQSVIINAVWCLFNLLLLVAACLVAFEQPQLRQSHRLARVLPVTLHSGDQSWTGKTVNVSESGCQIVLDEWPNIADEVQVELVGDYGERALMQARVVRAMANDQLQTLLSLNFTHQTQTQLDDWSVVLYSDVREWFSQRRLQSDNPWQSLGFITSSLRRAFQEFRPEVGVQVRKRVQATAQLYWEGWEGHSYSATVTELGLQDIRVELHESPFLLDLELLRQTRPAMGLLITTEAAPDQPQSLVAQVQRVEVLAAWSNGSAGVNGSQGNSPASTANPSDPIALTLQFPELLRRQQQSKIRQLLSLTTQADGRSFSPGQRPGLKDRPLQKSVPTN